MEKQEDKKVKLHLKGAIEVPSIDLQQYIGKKERIAAVEQYEGTYGYYLKVTSTVIDVLAKGKEPKEIRASRIFSLFTDKETGETGWGTKSKLAEYLKIKKVTSPEQLLGKEVVIQVEAGKEGKEFLSFV